MILRLAWRPSRGFVGALIVVVALCGAWLATTAAWKFHQAGLDRSHFELLVVQELDKIGMMADALTLLERGDTQQVKVLLETRMRSSLRQAEGLIREGHVPLSPSRSFLTDGVDRALGYAERQGLNADMPSQAETILAVLRDPDFSR